MDATTDATHTRRQVLGATLGLSGGLVAASVMGATAFDDAAAASEQTKPFPSSPEAALKRLERGNKRFAAGNARQPRQKTKRRVQVAVEQNPFAAILTCSDSRVPPEVIFDQGIGDLFVVRVAGNTANDPLIVGSIEYSIEVLGSVLVFVLGHSECGAVKAAIDVTKGATLPGDLNAVVEPIIPAVEAEKDKPEDELLDASIDQNIAMAMAALSEADLLKERIADGSLLIAGGEYELATGRIDYIP
jgi:carbonic anhydrase